MKKVLKFNSTEEAAEHMRAIMNHRIEIQKATYSKIVFGFSDEIPKNEVHFTIEKI